MRKNWGNEMRPKTIHIYGPLQCIWSDRGQSTLDWNKVDCSQCLNHRSNREHSWLCALASFALNGMDLNHHKCELDFPFSKEMSKHVKEMKRISKELSKIKTLEDRLKIVQKMPDKLEKEMLISTYQAFMQRKHR